jgi:hypothetical protein
LPGKLGVVGCGGKVNEAFLALRQSNQCVEVVERANNATVGRQSRRRHPIEAGDGVAAGGEFLHRGPPEPPGRAGDEHATHEHTLFTAEFAENAEKNLLNKN